MPSVIKDANRKLPSVAKLLLLVATSLPVTSFAQTFPSLPATVPPLADDPAAAAPPVFEVTLVKRNKSGGSNSGTNFQHGRFTASNILLKKLMQYEAYGIPEPRILAARSGSTLKGSTSRQRQIAWSPTGCKSLIPRSARFRREGCFNSCWQIALN